MVDRASEVGIQTERERENPLIIYLLKANLLSDSCDKTKLFKNNYIGTQRSCTANLLLDEVTITKLRPVGTICVCVCVSSCISCPEVLT